MDGNGRNSIQMYCDEPPSSEERHAAAVWLVRGLLAFLEKQERYSRPLIKSSLSAASKGKRGRKIEKNVFRDVDILAAIEFLQQLGYCPTANRESNSVSGCSIVAAALPQNNLSPIGVESIWRRRDHLARLKASATNQLFNTYD